MIQAQKESGLSIRQWCAERNISENAYYYRLRQLRQTACEVLEQEETVPPIAEVSLRPSQSSGMQLQIKCAGATIEITNADSNTLEHVLQVLIHADQCNRI